MKFFSRRALLPTICIIFLARWSYAEDIVFSAPLSSTAEESNLVDEGTLEPVFATYNSEVGQPPFVLQTSQSVTDRTGLNSPSNAERFTAPFVNNSRRYSVGLDLYSPPEFKGGLIVYGEDVAMKIGGYVKSDFIYDFDPIDSTDFFDTTCIPVGAPDRTNTRFHARQTRMSIDTRWLADEDPVRVFVEGDFYGDGNTFRLRHAYGEVGSLLAGQTWTTFTDVAAAPATLDFEGAVSNVNRRQAMIRWTQSVLHEDLKLAIAAENPQFDIVPPQGITGDARTPSPDLVGRLRLSKEWGQFQIAYLYRLGGFQETDRSVVTGTAWGLNFTGTILPTKTSKFYYQIVLGDGIGSYHGLPDAAPESANTDKVLGFTGWMVGYTRDWTDRLNSNFTYAENALSNSLLQQTDDVHRTTYLAANLIWEPKDRVNVGIEYLYGLRENIDRNASDAHRLQAAFIYYLP